MIGSESELLQAEFKKEDFALEPWIELNFLFRGSSSELLQAKEKKQLII